MNRKIKLLIEEKKRRDLPPPPPPDVLSAAQDYQKEFILDPSRRKAVLGARRVAKSFTFGIQLLHTCLNNKSVKCLYFGKTHEVAQNIMWLDIIFNLCERFDIKHVYNKNLQRVTFENKSSITLTGAGATDKQIERAIGGKYKLVIFDECQIIQNDLERWIKYRLGPAMVDLKGTICMGGTAGDYMGEHFWYKVTNDTGTREPGWSVYKWEWHINSYMKDLIAEELNNLKSLNPGIENTPGYRQEWLCEWVIETSSRIYKYDPTKNAIKDEVITASLKSAESKWKYIVSADFGFEDDTAFVVQAFSKHDPTHYIVESYKKKHLLTDDVAEHFIALNKKYKPIHMVVDAQEKRLAEDLRLRYRLPIVPANKLGKVTHIAFMNSDLMISRVKVIEATNRELIKEWNELNWAEKQRVAGDYKENPSKNNHLADAALYGHHFSKHFRATPEPVLSDEDFRIKQDLKQSTSSYELNNELNYHDQYEIQEFMSENRREYD